MTRVSVAAIRISNPKLSIVLACDEDTVAAMRQTRDLLLDEVDEVLACRTPEGEAGFRNRYVKTQLRRHIDGPFLFLDSDTLPRGNLSEIFLLDADIACAPDFSKDRATQQLSKRDYEILSLMGWRHSPDVFVNGGVIYYNDTPGSVRFADDWHQKWLSSYTTTKKYYDQPALNAAVFDSSPRITILPHRFNAQFVSSPSRIPRAAILHFWASGTYGAEPATEFEYLAFNLVNGAELRRSEVESMLRRDHPWRRRAWIDDLTARWVIKKDSFEFADYLWFQGRRMRSVRYRIQHSVRPVIGEKAYDRVKQLRTRARRAAASGS